MLLSQPFVTLVVTLAKYQGVQPHEHQAKTSHELLGGAAAFEVGPHLFL